MHLAISTYSLSRWRRENNKTLEQSLDWIASAGVSAVEFSGLDDRPAANPLRRAAALRRRCEKLNLRVAGYCVGAELLVEVPLQRRVIDDLKQHVDIAAALGAPTMRHDVTRGPKKPADAAAHAGRSPTLAQVLTRVVPAIREVSDYAQSHGIRTSLENHGFYMQPSRTVEKLLLAVAHPNFALTMDMGNFLCVNEDPVAAVRRLAKYAIMVHAKDFHVRPRRTIPATGWFATPTSIALRGAIAGHGVIDIPAQLKLLKKAGYDGYLSLEFEGMEEPTLAVRLGLDYLRRELASAGFSVT